MKNYFLYTLLLVTGFSPIAAMQDPSEEYFEGHRISKKPKHETERLDHQKSTDEETESDYDYGVHEVPDIDQDDHLELTHEEPLVTSDEEEALNQAEEEEGTKITEQEIMYEKPDLSSDSDKETDVDSPVESCSAPASSDTQKNQSLLTGLYYAAATSNICSFCDRSFSRLNALNNHIKIHTRKKKSFKCPTCGRLFTDASNLRKHQWTHSRKRLFKCDDCGQSFTQSNNLKRHERMHRGEKPFQCEYSLCNRSFTDQSNLNVHMNTHKRIKKLACTHQGCDQFFMYQRELTSHMRTHTSTPFKCPEKGCGKLFTQSNNFKRHKRIHTGEKPFACKRKDCKKSFSDQSSFRRHVLKAHPSK